MIVQKMGITEILRRIWLFSAKIKSSESFSKQPTQLIIAAHSCHIDVETVETRALAFLSHFWLQLVWPSLCTIHFRRKTAKKGFL